MYVCWCVCTYMRQSKKSLRCCFLWEPSVFWFLLVCFLRQNLTEEDRLSGQPGPGIHLSPLPQRYDCRLLYPVLNKHGLWGSDCPSNIHTFPLLLLCHVFGSLVFIPIDNAFQNTPSKATLNCLENCCYFCYCTLISRNQIIFKKYIYLCVARSLPQYLDLHWVRILSEWDVSVGKGTCCKADDPSYLSGTHMVRGENILSQVVLWPPHVWPNNV